MSNFISSFKRSRFVRRNKQRQGAQLQKLEGENDSLANVIRSAKGKQTNVIKQAQRKITVGKANDSYEVEADNVADKVVANSAQMSIQSKQEELAQTKPLLQKQEEEEAQAKPLLQKQEEEEDDELQAKPLLQKQEEEEDDEVQAKPLLQKQEEEEDDELQAKPLLQKQKENEMQAKPKAAKTSAQLVPDAMSQRLAARTGSGEKMTPKLQNFMQQQFQKDFSGVRIHTDAEAVAISQGMQAQAFALGKDIYFNQGKYQPESSQGKRLLAHELTHVVQQNSKLKKPRGAR